MGDYAGSGHGGVVNDHGGAEQVPAPMSAEAFEEAFIEAMVKVTKVGGTPEEAEIREYAKGVAGSYYEDHVADPDVTPEVWAQSDYECWDG